MTLSQPDPDSPYRTPGGKSLGTVAFLGAMALGMVGIVVVAIGPWRQGVGYVGGALLLACLARLVIPERMAGMLRVRRKAVDVVVLGLLGLGVVVLSLVVPDGRPASDQAEPLDRFALVDQLGGAGVDQAAGELVDLQPLHE